MQYLRHVSKDILIMVLLSKKKWLSCNKKELIKNTILNNNVFNIGDPCFYRFKMFCFSHACSCPPPVRIPVQKGGGLDDNPGSGPYFCFLHIKKHVFFAGEKTVCLTNGKKPLYLFKKRVLVGNNNVT